MSPSTQNRAVWDTFGVFLDWELANWQPDFMGLFWGFYRCPREAQDTDAINLAAQQCVKHLGTLDHALRDSLWLCGDTVSIADVCCGIGFHRYLNMGFEVEPPASVCRWVEALAQRPAWQATAMAPFADLHGRTDF